MTHRSLQTTPASRALFACILLSLAPAAFAQQQSPSASTSATTNLGTMVVSPQKAPAQATTLHALHIQRQALKLNLGPGAMPATTPNTVGTARRTPQARHTARATEHLPPRPLRIPPPNYPAQALAKGTQGTVTVTFTIRPDGSTGSIRIVRSTPPGLFDAAARAAVSRWRFRPAMTDGVAVSTRVTQTLQFRPSSTLQQAVAKQSPNPSTANSGTIPADSVPANIHPVRVIPPSYPLGAYRAHQGGRVTVAFTVMRNGQPRDIHILAAHPLHIFDRAATEAVRQWRFKPVAKPTRVVQTITFTPP